MAHTATQVLRRAFTKNCPRKVGNSKHMVWVLVQADDAAVFEEKRFVAGVSGEGFVNP
jgi:hypothetical protein